MWSIPLILLVAVALHQRWRVWTVGQNPWKGGGFAMFVDAHRTFDITEIHIEDAGHTTWLQIIGDHYPRRKAVTVPTRKNMLAWARWVAGAHWVQSGGAASLRSAGHGSAALRIR